MRIERLALGPLQTNCWLVSDDADGPVLVIDPGGNADALLREIGEREVAGVVLTHGHFDHLGAVGEVIEATGAPLSVHEADAESITDAMGTGGAPFGFQETAPPADHVLVEGDTVAAGNVELEVLHTPGHTPGSICLLGDGHLFSGDTIFQLGVGRTDFPGGDARALKTSIAERLAPLPDGTEVHPGHGPDTTIGHERRLNPFFPRD
jgi:glyoxylase-like metal-dependent hydrolase (beta-lactamase superfamily II)